MSSKSFLNRCKISGINPESVFCNRKKSVLIHLYYETGYKSIIAFSNDLVVLASVRDSHPRYGSSGHDFIILKNKNTPFLDDIKDSSLINICNNVAQYLSIGEYAMLKKSFIKASVWFEKAKNSSALGAEIIENY